jgi:hypothetical protein
MALEQWHRARNRIRQRSRYRERQGQRKAHAKTVQVTELDTRKCKGNL